MRYLLGEIYESQGDLERARAQFTAAMREDPNHLQATAKVRLLSATKQARPEAESGLFSRIFRRRDVLAGEGGILNPVEEPGAVAPRSRGEESPDSNGWHARQRRGAVMRRKVQQKTDRPAFGRGKGETVR